MRLRDAARTRGRILAAAQQVFSTKGYAQAGIRDIAAIAGVNVALVVKYFGPKDRLFDAALEAMATDTLWTAPREEFGRAVVGIFVDGEPGPNPLPMLMNAASDPAAQAIALDHVRRYILRPLARWLGEPEGTARAAEILALTAGFFMYRILLPLEPFEGTLDPAARRWLEESLQRIVDQAPAGA